MAQNEPFLLARFEPEYLALTDRNHWHKTNRFIHVDLHQCSLRSSMRYLQL